MVNNSRHEVPEASVAKSLWRAVDGAVNSQLIYVAKELRDIGVGTGGAGGPGPPDFFV